MQLGRRLDLPPRLEGVLLADFLGVGVPELVKPDFDGRLLPRAIPIV